NQVDVLLKDKKGNKLLYIETKEIIRNETSRRQALAQVILTNKKQEAILNKVALVYMDGDYNNILELIDCSDDSVMYNNDINWKAERASSPTKDAIDRINDRIKDKIISYKNDEIKEFYKKLKANQNTVIDITENNFNVVYNQWKQEVRFNEELDEQELINLFLVDMLNGTKYEKSVTDDYKYEQDLIREGTNLINYELKFYGDGKIDGIKYFSSRQKKSNFYTISNADKYISFWKKYKRPPEKQEFLNILERSSTLYSDKYRKDTGGEYTPTCFVEKQNEILAQHYNMDDFIVFDPCAGVGNLENQFGKDYKQYCYLSTLEQMDVDICKIKGFENAVQYDYLKDDDQPKWKYKGIELDINEICKRENRKLMIVMNPPYQKRKGMNNNLAIEFFLKVLKLKPKVIVFYYMTESFLKKEFEAYKNSGYKIVSHIFSNAKTTFLLSEWSISQVIFDKDQGEEIDGSKIKADRYELIKNNFNYVKTYCYDNTKQNFLNEIDRKIKDNHMGMILGNVSYLRGVINLTNKFSKSSNPITTDNIIWCLLSKGINFNTDVKYFERSYMVYKGEIKEISDDLFSNAIMFSLFYKGCAFTNKGFKNYIMPFTAEELGCAKNDLNVLFPKNNNSNIFQDKIEKPFDFREFLSQFEFSKEALNFYNAALEIFKYYHSNNEYTNKDWNDSFYDITNTIMGKDNSSFKELETENETRLFNKVRTTRGTRGFGRNTIKYAVNSEYIPMFKYFFDVRDILAKKINKQLVDQKLLLWERENIY
ncbi:MAG: hypothetical protein IKH10_00685, partial [Bacteroidetes bacterium]|nr:hypothetical protein [Bacteroidota bacterium]